MSGEKCKKNNFEQKNDITADEYIKNSFPPFSVRRKFHKILNHRCIILTNMQIKYIFALKKYVCFKLFGFKNIF